jgi:hypothetical protein
MNYLTEIRLFNEWLETHDISPPAFALWHGLMYIAWRSGWQPEFTVPVSVIMFRTGLCRSAVYKERNLLRDEGLIEFNENAGRQSAAYRIIGFEERLASIIRTQQDGEASTIRTQPQTQTENPSEASTVVSTIRTQPEIQSGEASIIRTQSWTQNENLPEASAVVSTMRTQPETQNGEASTMRTQLETQTEPPDAENPAKTVSDSDLAKEDTENLDLVKNENDPYISIYINKDRDKGGYRGKKRKEDETTDLKSPKKGKAGFDLSFIGEEVWEALVESWLDYKRSRSENYKSELSVKKFYTMLRGYSRGDPKLARQIIDKSIANNWAGIFEPAPEDSKPRNQSTVGITARPATGQHIGQIKQPEDEERRRKLLEKFGSSGNKDKNKT